MSPTGDPAGRRRATSADAFTSAIAAAATGVTVVATDGRSGRFGQTVSAMCRVSVSPPLVLACLHGRSPVSDAIRANGVFCVSVLGVQHDVVADTFARPWPGMKPWDFGCCRWEAAPSGSPRITDAVAAFDCDVRQVIPAGTHLIYLGQVQDVTTGAGVPLLYSARTYSRPEPFEPSAFASDPTARQIC